MPFRKSSSMDHAKVHQMAEGWGKIVARRVQEEVGPELDLDADAIEQAAVTAARAVAKGTIEELLEKKASLLGTEQPCPSCKRLCSVQRRPANHSLLGRRSRLRRTQVPLPSLPPGFFSLNAWVCASARITTVLPF